MNKQKNYILTIDQSTSATKVMLFDALARLVNRVSYTHQQYYPYPGFVEHDPEEIFNNTVKGINEIILNTRISAEEIACLSVTNQCGTA